MFKPATNFWLYLATILFTGLVLLISLSATMGWATSWFAAVRQIPGGDKLAHFVLIGGMSLLVNLCLRGTKISLLGRGVLLGSFCLFVLVTIEEFTQLGIANRTFDLADLASNYLGIFIFGQLANRLMKRQSCQTV